MKPATSCISQQAYSRHLTVIDVSNSTAREGVTILPDCWQDYGSCETISATTARDGALAVLYGGNGKHQIMKIADPDKL